MGGPVPVPGTVDQLTGAVGEQDVAAGVDITDQASFSTAWQHFANRLGKLNPALLKQAGKAHDSVNSLMRSR